MGVERVWYVAYGSNLSARRLQRYLDRCPDSEPPADRRPMELPHRLFFAHHSTLWDGGPAFVDPSVDGLAGTLATAWLLGVDQFLDVLAMENGRDPGARPHSALPGTVGSSAVAHDGRYGLVVSVPSPDARGAYTFTTSEQPLPTPTRPGFGYVDTIVSGLVEDHGLTDADARAYLSERGA